MSHKYFSHGFNKRLSVIHQTAPTLHYLSILFSFSDTKRLSETIEKYIKKTLHNCKKHNLYINDKAPTKFEIITNSKSAHYKPTREKVLN